MRLAGKTAIVTGAASGFGEGIATKFVAEGAKVLSRLRFTTVFREATAVARRLIIGQAKKTTASAKVGDGFSTLNG